MFVFHNHNFRSSLGYNLFGHNSNLGHLSDHWCLFFLSVITPVYIYIYVHFWEGLLSIPPEQMGITKLCDSANSCYSCKRFHHIFDDFTGFSKRKKWTRAEGFKVTTILLPFCYCRFCKNICLVMKMYC